MKNIALIAGTGIALGVYIASSARNPRRQEEGAGGPDALILEPLLDRLEQVEARFLQAGTNGAEAAEVQSLRQSMAAQEAELQALRAKVAETDCRAAAEVASVETRLREAIQDIGGLRDRAVESDANLQRLVAVVERLCDRPLQPLPTLLPFEAQLAEAAERDPSVETRVRVIKENDPARRPRFPLGRTFAFFLAALLYLKNA